MMQKMDRFQKITKVMALVVAAAGLVQGESELRVWNDTPPFRCPFEQSGTFQLDSDIWKVLHFQHLHQFL